jgi:hypothetical protein
MTADCYIALLGRSPVERRAELCLEETGQLSGLGKPPRVLLAEDQLIVEVDGEPTVARALELEGSNNRGPAAQELIAQAHGPVEIVSRDAVLDPNVV